MSKNYKQLSLEQRYQIEALVKLGMKQKYIADYLNVRSSTISRELKRNTACRGQTAKVYMARIASKQNNAIKKSESSWCLINK